MESRFSRVATSAPIVHFKLAVSTGPSTGRILGWHARVEQRRQRIAMLRTSPRSIIARPTSDIALPIIRAAMRAWQDTRRRRRLYIFSVEHAVYAAGVVGKSRHICTKHRWISIRTGLVRYPTGHVLGRIASAHYMNATPLRDCGTLVQRPTPAGEHYYTNCHVYGVIGQSQLASLPLCSMSTGGF